MRFGRNRLHLSRLAAYWLPLQMMLCPLAGVVEAGEPGFVQLTCPRAGLGGELSVGWAARTGL